MEVGFDKETKEKIEGLNTEGFTITDVKMQFYGDGVILHLEKPVNYDDESCKEEEGNVRHIKI